MINIVGAFVVLGLFDAVNMMVVEHLKLNTQAFEKGVGLLSYDTHVCSC